MSQQNALNSKEPAGSRADLRNQSLRTGIISLITHKLMGSDIFISYRRREARSYALELRSQLEAKRFRCFLDEALLPTGEEVDRYKRAARRSRMFVLVGSPAVFESKHIPTELQAYSEGHRGWFSKRWKRVFPINIAGGLDIVEDHSSRKKLVGTHWEPLVGLVCEPESIGALKAGSPSKSVVDRIEHSYALVRAAVMLSVGAILLAGGVFSITYGAIRLSVRAANRELGVAQGKLDEANRELGQINAVLDTTKREVETVTNARDAVQNELNQTTTQLKDTNSKLDTATNDVIAATAKATEAKAEADRQQAIADAQVIRNKHLHYSSEMNFLHRSYMLGAVGSGQKRMEDQRSQSKEFRGFEWYYLWRLYHPGITKLPDKDVGTSNTVVYSPDGKFFTTYGVNLMLWDAGSNQLLFKFKWYPTFVMSAVFSRDGKILASSHSGRTGPHADPKIAPMIKLWDVATQKEISTIQQDARNMFFLPEGKLLIVNDYGQARVVDPTTGKIVTTLESNVGFTSSVAVSQQGHLLAIGNDQGEIQVVDIKENKPVKVIKGSAGPVTALAFSPSGEILAAAGEYNLVEFWNTKTLYRETVLENLQRAVTSIAFSKNGETVGLCLGGHSISLWNTNPILQSESLIRLRKLAEMNIEHAYRVIFSPTSDVVAISRGVSVELWDYKSAPGFASFAVPALRVTSVAFSPDGHNIAVGATENSIRVWEYRSQRELQAYVEHDLDVETVAYSPDGRFLGTGSADTTTKLWDAQTRLLLKTFPGEDEMAVQSVAFSRSSGLMACGREDGVVKIFNTNTRQEIAALKKSMADIAKVAFSPTSETLLVVAGESKEGQGIIEFWNASSQQLLDTIIGEKGSIDALAFSRDGKLLAFGGYQAGGGVVWDLLKNQRIAVLKGHNGPILAIAFSPDAKTIATGSTDKTVKLWGVATYQEILTLSGHAKDISSLAFSPDGNTLASGSDDGTVGLWFAAKEEEVTRAER